MEEGWSLVAVGLREEGQGGPLGQKEEGWSLEKYMGHYSWV